MQGAGRPTGRGWESETTFTPKEFKTCNPEACPEVRRNTPWTPWLPVNVTQGGARQEQRFRFTCRAPLPDPHGLQFGKRRTETRTCPADGTGACDTDGTARSGGEGGNRGGLGQSPTSESLSLRPFAALVEDLLRSGSTSPHTLSGGWATWGLWSSCSRDCELGFRVRKRTCTNPEPRNGGLPCVGDAAEYQDCNPQACPGKVVEGNLSLRQPHLLRNSLQPEKVISFWKLILQGVPGSLGVFVFVFVYCCCFVGLFF